MPPSPRWETKVQGLQVGRADRERCVLPTIVHAQRCGVGLQRHNDPAPRPRPNVQQRQRGRMPVARGLCCGALGGGRCLTVQRPARSSRMLSLPHVARGYGQDVLLVDPWWLRHFHEHSRRLRDVTGLAPILPAHGARGLEAFLEHPQAGRAPGPVLLEPVRGNDNPFLSPSVHPNTNPILRPFQHHQLPHVRCAHRMGGGHALHVQPPPGDLLLRRGGMQPLLLHCFLHVLHGDRPKHGHPPIRRSHTQHAVPHTHLGQPHVVRDVRHVQGRAGRRKGLQHRSGQLPSNGRCAMGPMSLLRANAATRRLSNEDRRLSGLGTRRMVPMADMRQHTPESLLLSANCFDGAA